MLSDNGWHHIATVVMTVEQAPIATDCSSSICSVQCILCPYGNMATGLMHSFRRYYSILVLDDLGSS